MKALNVIELRGNRTERRRARHAASIVPRESAPSLAPPPAPVDRALLNQAVMLNWLGQQPVAFNRSYVDITGGVVSALWLSHVMDKMAARRAGAIDPNGDYVFEMTGRECEQDTGITRGQQGTCRRQLSALGLLTEESRQGKVARYRLHVNRLMQCLIRQAGPLAAILAQSAEADGPAGLSAVPRSA